MSTAAAARDAIAPAVLCPLAGARDDHQTGGKAAGLARLIAFGVPVPDGVVLTRHSFESFIAQGQLARRIDALWGATANVHADATRGVADEIRALVMAAPLPLAIEASLQTIARRLLPGPIAVRSSAIGEDGEAASFAGQFDTVLNVRSIAGLRGALLSATRRTGLRARSRTAGSDTSIARAWRLSVSVRSSHRRPVCCSRGTRLPDRMRIGRSRSNTAQAWRTPSSAARSIRGVLWCAETGVRSCLTFDRMMATRRAPESRFLDV